MVFFVESIFAFDLKSIVAYPVPFNPKNGVLTVEDRVAAADKISITIYDINGDKVFSSSNASSSITWNGRNRRGMRVKPGLYLIRVTVEDNSGDYGKKVIRILVNY
ncbi:T9SS type A sorting domain-containing protein [Spirochaetota bacterium]